METRGRGDDQCGVIHPVTNACCIAANVRNPPKYRSKYSIGRTNPADYSNFARSRIWNFWILPVDVRGISVKTNFPGTLYGAR